LLDADRRHPTQHLFFDIEPERGWDEVAQNAVPMEKAFYQVGRRNLFLGAITQFSSPVPQIFSNPGIDTFWKKLKQRFDLILIDSPPTTASPEGLAICGKVDGVILVVEAEQVRWPVVQNTKENVLRNGGKILGIVFNKRQHYIPEFVYKRL
jgi:Mrp family chromosome partitioning ATPase